MKETEINMILKSISLIAFVSIFQPFLDIFLLFQYGPAASCIDCFIIQQTFFISLFYLVIPLTVLYLILKILNWNSMKTYIVIGIPFAVISFNKITLLLFRDRIAAWSTYSESEIFNSALIMSAPTLLIQVLAITKLLYKVNQKKNSC